MRDNEPVRRVAARYETLRKIEKKQPSEVDGFSYHPWVAKVRYRNFKRSGRVANLRLRRYLVCSLVHDEVLRHWQHIARSRIC